MSFLGYNLALCCLAMENIEDFKSFVNSALETAQVWLVWGFPFLEKSTSFKIFRISNGMAWFECWKRTKIIFHLIWITICSNCQLNFFKFQKRIKKPWQNLEVIQSEWIAGWRKKVSHSSSDIHFLFAFVSASNPSYVVTNFLSHYSVTNLVPNNDKHAILWPLASLMVPFYLSARPFIILLL